MDTSVLSVVTSGTEHERLKIWIKLQVGHQEKAVLWSRYEALLLAKSKLCDEYAEASSFGNWIMVSNMRDQHMDPEDVDNFHHVSIAELERQKQRVITLEKGARTMLREIIR